MEKKVTIQRKAGWEAAPEPTRVPLRYKILSDVETEEVKWVWYPYIPAGKLSLLEGDPGQGKSWITCSVAADISAGRALPGQDSPLPPQKVLMLSAEDGLGDTVKPRIQALQGNMDNIFVSDDFFVLDKQGIQDMEDLMRLTSATIVFMDPIVAYMGSKVDMHRANEVRGLMTALAEAAKRTGSAIVAVRHLRKAAPGTKGSGGKAIYSGIGSIDFTAAVRSVMQVGESKNGVKYMYHAKHNLTPKGKTLSYEIGDGAFKWMGEFEGEQEDNHSHTVSTTPKSVAKAQDFLYATLRDGPIFAIELMERAAQAGISLGAIQRAKKGIAYSRKQPDGWVWYLEEREGMGDTTPLLPKNLRKDPEIAALLAEAQARLAGRGGVE